MRNVLAKYWWLLIVVIIILIFGLPMSASAANLKDNPNVTWSPDGQAFTTDANETDFSRYGRGTVVDTGVEGALEALSTGQHYYLAEGLGNIPIGKWEVSWEPAGCIHTVPEETIKAGYHGLEFGIQNCKVPYKSGWIASCADCGEKINILFYMDKETAQSITYLPENQYYYYLCPQSSCRNLEQGAKIKHECKKVSYNKYYVEYKNNSPSGTASGYMMKSTFMYNNANEYNGEPITADTRLRKCVYTRSGYTFTGWNTKPDGTGESFVDEQEIYNLITAEKGKITLYAQWKKSVSTLYIDPAGGSYDGINEKTGYEQGYNTTLQLKEESIVPPSGNKISFETNGGSAVADIFTEKYFAYWIKSNPFYGNLEDAIYTFKGANGTKDILTASYATKELELPETNREGYYFGGWYLDEECMVPVGFPGDKVIFEEDTVLYAKWVNLQLTATDNYVAFDGSGAVDLSWVQDGNEIKTYAVYQKQEDGPWTRLAKSDAGSPVDVNESFSATKTEETYTVPYTGLYTITLAGAQGGGYEAFSGGKGGQVSAKVWLTKGEVLTYHIGTTDGYNGGGNATAYGNGGGMTDIYSDIQGLLLIAGGGGGATSVQDGGPGGLQSSVITNNTRIGESAAAGGGGGYQGGTGGEWIQHFHDDDCISTEYMDYLLFESDWWSNYQNHVTIPSTWYGRSDNYKEGTVTSDIQNVHSEKITYTAIEGHTNGSTVEMLLELGAAYGNAQNKVYPSFSEGYIPVMNNTSLSFDLLFNVWGDIMYDQHCTKDENRMRIYNQNGELIYDKHLSEFKCNIVEYLENNYTDVTYYIQDTISIPEGTTSVYFSCYIEDFPNTNRMLTLKANGITFNGGVLEHVICGHQDGEILANTMSGGGSNYINGVCTTIEDVPGVGTGDGSIKIELAMVEHVDEQYMNDVSARDNASPDAVNNMIKKAISESKVQVIWDVPLDYGTVYSHYVESYNALNGNYMCTSNITVNTLVSGIKGYLYCITDSMTCQESDLDLFESVNALQIEVQEKTQYLHIAAIDVAGNLSVIKSIRIDGEAIADDDIPIEPWDIETEQISIDEDVDNVYAAVAEKTWYVRADGETPFLLSSGSLLSHMAVVDYQPNYMIFDVQEETGQAQQFEIFVPNGESLAEEIVYTGGKLQKNIRGMEILQDSAYTIAQRSIGGRALNMQQRFTISSDYDGKSLQVVPIAGAVYEDKVKYSDYEKDILHGIRLIADGQPPEVYGTDILESLQNGESDIDSMVINLSCADSGSGVREFYVEVENLDNYDRQTFKSENAQIQIDLANQESSVFNGDYVLTIHAIDNVGNDSALEYFNTGFTLKATVTRVRAPHEPIMQRGEYGLLTILTTGYVDKVVVEPVTSLLPEGAVFEYATPSMRQEEEILFLVPLDTLEGIYDFKVHAYKNGKELFAEPEIGVLEVSGTILDDFRRQIIW